MGTHKKAAGDGNARGSQTSFGSTASNYTADQSFLDAIVTAGITPPEHIVADGKRHRFSTNGKATDTAGWYILHLDNIPAGAFGCWRACYSQTWRLDVGRELTAEEEADHRRKVATIRAERKAAEERDHSEAAKKAAKMWDAATPATGDHPYLTRKGVQPNGARVRSDGALLIPMQDAGGNIRNVEQISRGGFKWGLTGGRRSGLFYRLGGTIADGTAYFCEGFSTGASIHEATGKPVVVCFNAGNLVPAAKAVRKAMPLASFVFCADDDSTLKDNVGVNGARAASDATGGRVVVPEGFNDFNDMHQALGLEAVAKTVLDVPAIEKEPSDVADWLSAFHVSKEVMDKVAHPEWIYENLVIQGHVIAIVAAPNGGKTTIMLQVSADMAARGYRVIYVNADTSGGDAKAMKDFADEKGFEMILPDLVAGKSMKDVVDGLQKMALCDADLSKLAFIFDTLKKMTNVIHKQQSAALYKTLRSLSGKGLTSIALGHTNKYKDSDGKPVYEGTGDLRADVDELIYLTGDKKPDGTMLVSTIPDKMRGAFKPISFKIDAERNVTRCGYVDVGEEVRRKKRYASDQDAIEAITEALGDKPIGKTELLNAVRKNGVGRNRARTVLERYCGPDAYRECWIKEIGFANNVIKFRRIKAKVVSSDHTSVGGDDEQ